MLGKARGRYSVAERVEQFGPAVEKRLAPVFESAGSGLSNRRRTFRLR